jgi:hypothetical protein
MKGFFDRLWPHEDGAVHTTILSNHVLYWAVSFGICLALLAFYFVDRTDEMPIPKMALSFDKYQLTSQTDVDGVVVGEDISVIAETISTPHKDDWRASLSVDLLETVALRLTPLTPVHVSPDLLSRRGTPSLLQYLFRNLMTSLVEKTTLEWKVLAKKADRWCRDATGAVPPTGSILVALIRWARSSINYPSSTGGVHSTVDTIQLHKVLGSILIKTDYPIANVIHLNKTGTPTELQHKMAPKIQKNPTLSVTFHGKSGPNNTVLHRLASAKIDSIRIDRVNGRARIDGEICAVGSVVWEDVNVRLVAITAHSLVFADENNEKYFKKISID